MSPRSITAASRVLLAAAAVAIFLIATTDATIPVIEDTWDKLDHLVAFAVLSLLSDRAFPDGRFGPAKVLGVLAYGAAIEVVQSFLPHREASLADLLADGVGIALYAASRPLFLRIPVLRPPAKG